MAKRNIFIPILFLSFSLFCMAVDVALDLEIKSTQPFQPWEPNQIQKTVLIFELPKDFYAYRDQIKILNIKPSGFISGEIRLTPEIEFYDKYSQKNRFGTTGAGTISILLEASEQIPKNLKQIELDLRYQICSPKVCYLPKTQSLTIDVLEHARQEPTTTTQPLEMELTNSRSDLAEKTSSSLFANFEKSLQSNLPFAFILVFLAGVLTSFTPCIFPMLPITLSVLGHHAESRTRLQNLTRTIVYVLGISVTYSTLGVIAALTGNLFGAALTNKYVLLALCILFFVMAFSMWGAFELQAPRFIRNRFSSGKSKNSFEAFVLGLVAGIVASPCVGPILISILTFVSTTRNVFLGFSLLFVYALGLGLLFMVMGFFGEALRILPKSGPWMNFVKFVLGSCMWVAALYYLQFAVPKNWWVAGISASFVALAVWQGAFHFHKRAYFKQNLLLVLFICCSAITVFSIFQSAEINALFESKSVSKKMEQANWQPFSEAEVQKAIANHQPILIDFFAEWCAACHELEEKTYTNAEFLKIASQFKLFKVDATNDNEQTQKILKKYQVQGLPTVLFINRKGDLLKHLTFTQFINWDEFKPKLLENLK